MCPKLNYLLEFKNLLLAAQDSDRYSGENKGGRGYWIVNYTDAQSFITKLGQKSVGILLD